MVYEDFDFLAFPYVKKFVQNWKRKVRKIKNDEKRYEFDKFISHFIIYAALVNVIKPQKEKVGKDRKYCTEVICDLLCNYSSNLNNLIKRIDISAKELGSVIITNNFSVLSSDGTTDPKLSENWNSGNHQSMLLSLLQTLYFMRCNIFHGAKSFSEFQVRLLRPANKILSIVNEEIQNIYSTFEEEFQY